MDPLVSIIIPVFNTSKYLQKCVDSVQKQTYKNLEIILVDDGSTDRSGVLCDELKNQDKRISVIHKANGGLSSARNAGISIAKGKYIVFVDSDDWIEKETIEYANANMAKTDSDLVIWSYYADFVDLNQQVKHVDKHALNGVCDHSDYTSLLNHASLGLIGYAWNKLYKKEIIDRIGAQFPEGISLVEDILFNQSIICECNRISFISFLGTHYIQRNEITLGRKYYPDYIELKIRACEAREIVLSSFNVPERDVQRIMSSSYLSVFKGGIRNINNQNISREKTTEECRRLLDSEAAANILTKVVPCGLKELICYYLIKYKMVKTLLLLL